MQLLVASFAAAVLALAPASHQSAVHMGGSPARSASAQPTLEARLVGQINAVRRRHRLRTLRVSRRLTAAAHQHSVSMAASGYFRHDSANGTAFWKRIAGFYGYRGYRSWSVGENLLWSSPDVTPSRSVRTWLGSPEHRANLLDRNWREIGVSAVHANAAPGVYRGGVVTIITADFGFRV